MTAQVCFLSHLDHAIMADFVVGGLSFPDGKLVFEEHFPRYRVDYTDEQLRGEFIEFDADPLHNLMSITKVFTSARVGIGIDQGAIHSVDEKVFTYVPQHTDLLDEGKAEINLEHLLTMTSGVRWNEWDVPLTNTDSDLI